MLSSHNSFIAGSLKPLLTPSLYVNVSHHSPISPSLRRAYQTLTASRILPYPAAPLYDIIADIDAYSRFVPYCSSSRVTVRSKPHPSTGKRYPLRGELTTGFKGIEETFASKVYCVPGKVVEAVGGTARTTVDEQEWMEVDPEQDSIAPSNAPSGYGRLLSHLLTRWEVESLDRDLNDGKPNETPRTRINLRIEYELTNPIYMAISQAFEGKVAGIVIEAFEKRTRDLLE